jgi:nucleoside-diphosphate-sugar epimerase
LRLRSLLLEVDDGPVTFPIQGTGHETRAFVYIDDFIDGFAAMLKGDPGTYHIGNDDEVSIARIAEMIGSCFGRDLVIQPASLQPGSTERRCPDISKLRRLGFVPRVTLQEALAKTVTWYRQNAHLAPAK